jgi:uncharacterized protein with HEPN domain
MTADRLADYLDHMRQAATDARTFVQGHSLASFRGDRRTQQAVIMSLVIIGEAATKIMDAYPAFAESRPDIPWRAMRGMRNRMTHGYFDTDLDIVWQTVQTSIVDLTEALDAGEQR